MSVEKFLFSINDIKDDYIREYAIESQKKRRKVFYSWKTIGQIAACFVLVCCTASVLWAHLGKAQMEDPRCGIKHTFEDYMEICEILPKEELLANIPNAEKAVINGYGWCYDENNTDFMDYNQYSLINLEVQYDDGRILFLYCDLNPYYKNVEDYVASQPLTFLPEFTTYIEIMGIDVCINYYQIENSTDKMYTAVFYENGHRYQVRSRYLELEGIQAYINALLSE